MRKTSFDQEIISSVDYYIGFVHFVKTISIKCVRNISNIYGIGRDTYIITSSGINLETINFTEWYEANKTLLWEFSEEFVKYVFDELLDKFSEGKIHIIHVDGYFPLTNTTASGECIKEVIKKHCDPSRHEYMEEAKYKFVY